MTERTVTVQTEAEETITLCDECGLSDDAGEIVTYRPKDNDNWGEYDCIDLHRHCLDDLGVDVPEAPTYAEFVHSNNEYGALPWFAFAKLEIGVFSLSLVLIVVGLIGITTSPLFVGMAFVGSLLFILAMGIARELATEPVEELKNA